MDKVAVVILNWNGCEMLQRFLPNVVRLTEGDGGVVWVADNGSTDASVGMLRRDFPSVRLIVLEHNYGFAEGYNRALAQVEAEYVVLLNSDVEVTEHWLRPLVAYMDEHPGVAACQPKLRSWRERDRFEYAGAAGGFIDRYGYPFCRGRLMGNVEQDRGQYDTVLPVFWASGAALFIRRADYMEAGGLDSRFFAHMEEIDLCWSCRTESYGLFMHAISDRRCRFCWNVLNRECPCMGLHQIISGWRCLTMIRWIIRWFRCVWVISMLMLRHWRG